MGTDIFRDAEEGNIQFLRSLQELNVTPDTGYIRGIDFSEHFVSFWDEDFKLLRLNNSCYSRCIVDHSLPDEEIFGLPVADYFPDLKKDALSSIHSDGGIYTVDNYGLKGHNLDTRIRCEITVSKVNNTTIIFGEDITDTLERMNELNACMQRIRELENHEADMNIALDILLQRLQTKEQEICNNYRTNIEGLIIPLLSTLEEGGLKNYQQDIIDAIRENISTFCGSSNSTIQVQSSSMTAREREIAGLIKIGKTTKEISNMLCLSTKTVDTHRANIRRKLSVPSTVTNLYLYLNNPDNR